MGAFLEQNDVKQFKHDGRKSNRYKKQQRNQWIRRQAKKDIENTQTAKYYFGYP